MLCVIRRKSQQSPLVIDLAADVIRVMRKKGHAFVQGEKRYFQFYPSQNLFLTASILGGQIS